MDWTQDIRTSLSAWHNHHRGMRELKQMADCRPNLAALAFESATLELQKRSLIDAYYYHVLSPQARHIRRLGEIETPEEEAEKEALFNETYYHDHERYEELAAQGFFDLPKEKEKLLKEGPSLNLDEEMRGMLAGMQLRMCQLARHGMSVEGEKSRAGGEDYYCHAVCEVCLETFDQFPVLFAGVVQEKWGGNPKTRQSAVASLSGRVLSELSLEQNPRLRAAIENAWGGLDFESIVRAVPGAVVVEWAALQREEPLSRLKTRVEQHLLKEGGQVASKTAKSEAAELVAFVERENMLRLAKEAGLTPRESEVFGLLLKNPQMKNREVADELGVSVSTIGTLKSRMAKALADAR